MSRSSIINEQHAVDVLLAGCASIALRALRSIPRRAHSRAAVLFHELSRRSRWRSKGRRAVWPAGTLGDPQLSACNQSSQSSLFRRGGHAAATGLPKLRDDTTTLGHEEYLARGDRAQRLTQVGLEGSYANCLHV